MFVLLGMSHLWILLAIALLIAGGILMSRFCRLLRVRHREEWTRLGEPAVLSHLPMSVQWKLNAFLWRGQYRTLEDSALSRLAVAVKILTVVVGLLILLGGIYWPAGGAE